MADYTYNDALNRLIKHLEIKNAGSYISNMSGTHRSNVYNYLSNRKKLGINTYREICSALEVDPSIYLKDTFNAVLLNKYLGGIRAIQVLKSTDLSPYIEALKEEGGEYYANEKLLIPLKYDESHYDIIEIVGNAMNDGTDRSISNGTLVLAEVVDINSNLSSLRIYNDLFFLATDSGVILTKIQDINLGKGTIMCSFLPSITSNIVVRINYNRNTI